MCTEVVMPYTWSAMDALARRPVRRCVVGYCRTTDTEVRCAQAGGGTAPADDRAVFTAIVFVPTQRVRVAAAAAGIRGERADRAPSVLHVGRRRVLRPAAP